MEWQVENKNAVDPASGMGDQRRADAAVIGMVLIGGERPPIVEVDGETVQVTPLDLLWAFAPAGMDRTEAGDTPPDAAEIGENSLNSVFIHVGTKANKNDMPDHGLTSVCRADHVGGLFADHDRGRVGVGRHKRRHDGIVDNAQAFDSTKPQLRINDRSLIRSHATSA
jgi:hypothetical protein